MQVNLKRKAQERQSFVTIIVVRRRMGQRSQGILAIGQNRFICALGASGIVSQKYEGDGATPRGVMKVLQGFRQKNVHSRTKHCLKMRIIGNRDGWCDENWDANYNRPVRLPYRASAEEMQRKDEIYDMGLIVDWNIQKRVMNRGSAIFMHLARKGYTPTRGCIALSRRDMERVFTVVSNKTRLLILG
ncbi:L,D-transpeptidase family protein [Bartonella tamiae]|uniref:L,D-TPase catalytic domain-containing protein n=1 Tax=Bartonella tamiae Th239 TaxID=1094558 RepID=J1K0R2_9HYPH|nr:L,D-transpeptidase family protein [Bartonella tamiae]EJF91007.1 hypothetical protein ME5_00339 [Bartonella tamiae Th239]EJF93328.1 hypothetical protein MEG_01542 [Bartonella tamiae Th307]